MINNLKDQQLLTKALIKISKNNIITIINSAEEIEEKYKINIQKQQEKVFNEINKFISKYSKYKETECENKFKIIQKKLNKRLINLFKNSIQILQEIYCGQTLCYFSHLGVEEVTVKKYLEELDEKYYNFLKEKLSLKGKTLNEVLKEVETKINKKELNINDFFIAVFQEINEQFKNKW